MTKTYKVPGANISALKRRLDVLARRANRLGCPPITFTVGAPETVEYRDEHGFRKMKREYPVSVEGPEPKIGDWIFLAAIDLIEDEFLVRAIGDVTEFIKRKAKFPNLKDYAGAGCDHCNLDRKRKNLFLVGNDAGEIKRVGRTCLKDFTGHGDPEALVKGMTYLMEAKGLCEDAEALEGGGGGGDKTYNLLTVLAFADAVIGKHGWLGKGKAHDLGGVPTADYVSSLLNSPKNRPLEIEITKGNREKAEAAAEWLAELGAAEEGDLNDYLDNLAVIGRLGYVPIKNLGLTVSAVNAYDRELADRAKKALATKLAAESDHFGKLKERKVFTLTHLSVFAYEGNYGITFFNLFVDPDGNVAVWATNKAYPVGDGEKFVPGVVYKIKGTVKKHGEYNGIKETNITRCVVMEVLGEAAKGEAA